MLPPADPERVRFGAPLTQICDALVFTVPAFNAASVLVTGTIASLEVFRSPDAVAVALKV